MKKRGVKPTWAPATKVRQNLRIVTKNTQITIAPSVDKG